MIDEDNKPVHPVLDELLDVGVDIEIAIEEYQLDKYPQFFHAKLMAARTELMKARKELWVFLHSRGATMEDIAERTKTDLEIVRSVLNPHLAGVHRKRTKKRNRKEH